MAFAATLLPITYAPSIDGSSVAALLAAIHSELSATGWPFTTITGGHQYQMTSPQTVAAYLRVWDDSSGYVNLQVTNLAGTNVGLQHKLHPVAARVFQLWADICQLFISIPGNDTASANYNTTFSCGVPFVAVPGSSCVPDTGADMVTECWWSAGNDFAPGLGNPSRNWRWTYLCDAFSTSFTWKGVSDVMRSDLVAYSDQSALWLLSEALPLSITHSFWPIPRAKWFCSLGPDSPTARSLKLDPLMAWGKGTDLTPARIRAQLWDAFLLSSKYPLDQITTYDGLTFINFTEHTGGQASRFMALQLLTSVPGTGGALTAYMY